MYFTLAPLDEQAKVHLPTWLLNTDSCESSCLWRGCSVLPLVPCLVPAALKRHGSVLRISDELEGLPRHAVRCGIWLNATNLKSFCLANRVPEPAGTGALQKNGKANVLKKDWALAVIKHFFPDATLEQTALMLEGMLGQGQTKSKKHITCPDSVINAVSCLDPADANIPMFAGLKQMAQQIKEQADTEAKAPRGRRLVNQGLNIGFPSRLHGFPSWFLNIWESDV